MNPIQSKAYPIQLNVDFVFSPSLENIENGINTSVRGIDTVNLAIAVALDRIEREKLYEQKGYKSSSEYFNKSNNLNLPKQTLSSYRKIGRAYFQYRKELQSINFNPVGNFNKLRFLDEALQRFSVEEVLENIQIMSLRKFMDWVKKPIESSHNDQSFIITNSGLINSKDETILNFKDIENILNIGEIPLLLGVKNETEKLIIQEALTSYRNKKAGD
ncbi:hypothetical protein [Spirochaeta cellobiosiphila]|uniref:hypothetical protein n=1 Tax=Spirochaeta cellobiosiphila TaxID=504483 RepID=UPI00040525BB|nr:hypothetical protein [Spirochaeta cellobiosiphila]